MIRSVSAQGRKSLRQEVRGAPQQRHAPRSINRSPWESNQCQERRFYFISRRSQRTRRQDPSQCQPQATPAAPAAPSRRSATGPLAIHWAQVSSGKRGLDLETFCDQLRALPAGTPFRHNQAGDLPGANDRIDREAAESIAKAAAHLDGWTYTHYPPRGNLRSLRAVSRGLVVNLSANDLAQADEYSRTGLPVVCVVPADHPERSTTPDGRPVVVCPEQTGRAASCADCMLCARPSRRVVVAFRRH